MRRDIGSVVKATGVIKPMVGAEVRVGSSVSAVVSRLCVRIGDRVGKGELLAELDTREGLNTQNARELFRLKSAREPSYSEHSMVTDIRLADRATLAVLAVRFKESLW